MLGFWSSFNLVYTIEGHIVQRRGNGIRTIFSSKWARRPDALLLRTVEIGLLFGLPFLTDDIFANLYANHPQYFFSYLVLLGIWTYLVPIRGQLGGKWSKNEKIGISLSAIIAIAPLVL